MSSKYQLVVFDLDGTLIDSETDLMISSNYTMEQYGYPARTEAEVRSFIGNGAFKLLERSLPPECHQEGSTFAAPVIKPEIDFQAIYETFMTHYLEHCHENTFIHDGVIEYLDSLVAIQENQDQDTQLKLAVLTNKPIQPTLQIIKHLKLDHYFFQIIGGDSFEDKKPNPIGLNHIIAESGVRKDQVLMVGDGQPDMQVANHAGVDSLAILEGIGDENQLIAEKPTYSIRRFADISKLQLQIG